MSIFNDQRVVMTLDAGGTNFVFSAIQGGEQIVEPIQYPSNGHNLEKSLTTIIEGFELVRSKLDAEPVAISFAFPGPADYPKGIIKDLQNLSGFKGGVALGPMLERKFKLPVFINNDGDLYAYGEAIAGLLPQVNSQLAQKGIQHRYKNLVGITLGTGLGGGIVTDGRLLIGDNSLGGEIWIFRNRLEQEMNAEEGACIRAVQRYYAQETGIENPQSLSPKDIYEIGIGEQEGNQQAAILAFEKLGTVLGEVLSHLTTLVDGLIVIGGGLSGAYKLFMPAAIKEMQSHYQTAKGEAFPRLQANIYDLTNKDDLNGFYTTNEKAIKIPFTDEEIIYNPDAKVGVGVSTIGTSKAISIGAYAYALSKL
ncbi:ROK family protein [Limibacter armeniacum]|uniref:ROK family protein n=1 Tax=Limibacter armeniacum TaxID=466084 RepID=UPI002FE55AC1